VDHTPCSESEDNPSWNVTDASNASGKPLGNAAVSGTLEGATKKGGIFLLESRRRSFGWFLLDFAETFNVDLFSFSKLSTMFALCHRSAFPLDFEKWSVGVSARGRTMALYASFAVDKM
jgi:hypothetical protein